MNAPGETNERRPVSSEAASMNRLTTCNQNTPAGIDLHASRPVCVAAPLDDTVDALEVTA